MKKTYMCKYILYCICIHIIIKHHLILIKKLKKILYNNLSKFREFLEIEGSNFTKF